MNCPEIDISHDSNSRHYGSYDIQSVITLDATEFLVKI